MMLGMREGQAVVKDEAGYDVAWLERLSLALLRSQDKRLCPTADDISEGALNRCNVLLS